VHLTVHRCISETVSNEPQLPLLPWLSPGQCDVTFQITIMNMTLPAHFKLVAGKARYFTQRQVLFPAATTTMHLTFAR